MSGEIQWRVPSPRQGTSDRPPPISKAEALRRDLEVRSRLYLAVLLEDMGWRASAEHTE